MIVSGLESTGSPGWTAPSFHPRGDGRPPSAVRQAAASRASSEGTARSTCAAGRGARWPGPPSVQLGLRSCVAEDVQAEVAVACEDEILPLERRRQLDAPEVVATLVDEVADLLEAGGAV
jgi:hypothetical protein